MRHKLLGWTALLLLAYCGVETVSYAGTSLIQRRDPWLFRLDAEELLSSVTPEEFATYRDWLFDPTTGWDFRPGFSQELQNSLGKPFSFTIDEYGARRDAAGAGEPLVSVYGDSFGFGHEVDDHEAFPAVLSRLIDRRVLNYAVPATGPDQALLKLERILGGAKPFQGTPLVVLQMNSDSVVRVTNMYRPLINPEIGVPMGFKPRYFLHGGGLTLVNPLPTLSTPEDFQPALDIVRAFDPWYTLDRARPANAFPFTLTFARVGWLEITGGQPAPPQALYEEGWRILGKIIERFHAVAVRQGRVPVLLMIPVGADLAALHAGGRVAYGSFLDAVRRTFAGTELRVVDVAAHPFDTNRFSLKGWDSHSSPYGNEVTAQILAASIDDLVESGLQATAGP